MTVEQELAEIIKETGEWFEPKERDFLACAEAILSSGLVIPVSALDEDKILMAIIDAQVAEFGDHDRAFCSTKAAINAIEQEAGK